MKQKLFWVNVCLDICISMLNINYGKLHDFEVNRQQFAFILVFVLFIVGERMSNRLNQNYY